MVLELRFLCSTGITRLHRSDEALRHPSRPGLSLAGCRLKLAVLHRDGFPVLTPELPCLHAVTTTPANGRAACFARLARPASLPRASTGSAFASHFSRLARCSLRLRPVGSLTRLTSLCHRELRRPPLPVAAVPTASGGAKVAGWVFHFPTEVPRFHGAPKHQCQPLLNQPT